jgi:hypothetical protein
MSEKAKVICPMMGGQECVGDGALRVVDGKPEMVKCRFWVFVQGKNPQTGEVVNNGDCAFCWTPVLLIENSKVNRETGAAVESLRNEAAAAQQLSHSPMGGIVQAIGQVQQLALSAPAAHQEKVIEGDKS